MHECQKCNNCQYDAAANENKSAIFPDPNRCVWPPPLSRQQWNKINYYSSEGLG
eukprot:m.102985 g.102985  ORF g.102985 m.102985 type:complete len:54 (+) comp16832_c0_seq3:1903-2064(+)